MSFELDVEKDTKLRVIVHKDSAIGNRDGYAAYLESFKRPEGASEEHLGLKEGFEPTRFIMRKTIPFKHKMALRSRNIKVSAGKGNDAEPEVSLSVNYSIDNVRYALIDIENPAGVPDHKKLNFKRGSDGLVSDDLLGMLDAAKVLDDLSSAYANATESSDKETQTGKNS